MNITIKKPETDEEIEGKGYVHYKSWQETYPGLIDQKYLDSMSVEKSVAVAYRWRDDDMFVAKDGEAVVGFVCFGKCRDDDLTDAGEIYAIYVLAKYYGKGVGRALMDAALEQLVQPRVAVWVLQGNERAIRFYRKCGFVLDGMKKALKLGTAVYELRMVLNRNNENK